MTKVLYEVIVLPFRLIDAICQFIFWPPSTERWEKSQARNCRSYEYLDRNIALIRQIREMEITYRREIAELQRRHEQELRLLKR